MTTKRDIGMSFPSSPFDFRSWNLVEQPSVKLAQNIETNNFISNNFPAKDHSFEQPRKQPTTFCNESKKHGWDNPQPCRLGMFDRISKYHVEKRKESINDVLALLQETFRGLSLQVIYSNSPLSAHCLACLDSLEFNVTIWDKGSNLVIEVERVSGCFVAYKTKYVDPIISKLQGKERLIPMNAIMSNNIEMQKHQEVELLIHNNVPSYLRGTEPLIESLRVATDLLKSGLYDARGHGLEILLQLTDPSKSGWDIANRAARIVLLSMDSAEEAYGGWEMLEMCHNMRSEWNYIQATILNLALAGKSFDEKNGQYQLLDHSLAAMAVLAQAVNLLNTSELTMLIQYECPNTPTTFIDSLLHRMYSASLSPHMAYLATHILASIGNIPEVHDRVREHADMVHRAHYFGFHHHAALEQASERLLQTILTSAA